MRVVLCVLALAACGDDGATKKDAAVDGPGDGSGGNQVLFQTGYLDWLSVEGPNFCGIFMATVTNHANAMQTFSTPPNGRIDLMVPATGITRFDVTPPTMPSGCVNTPGTYTTPSIILADPAVIATQAIQEARDFTTEELPSLGFTPNATKAHVFVHVEGTKTAVTIAASHDPSQAFDGMSWAAGSTGNDVFFPNVDPTAGSTMVVMGGATGETSVPLVAGTITSLTLVGH